MPEDPTTRRVRYVHVVKLTPEQYAAISALIIHNDALGHGGIYMDLPTKKAWSEATMEKVDV